MAIRADAEDGDRAKRLGDCPVGFDALRRGPGRPAGAEPRYG
jgi:hypothetical protein